MNMLRLLWICFMKMSHFTCLLFGCGLYSCFVSFLVSWSMCYKFGIRIHIVTWLNWQERQGLQRTKPLLNAHAYCSCLLDCMKFCSLDDGVFTRQSLSSWNDALYGRIVVWLPQELLDYTGCHNFKSNVWTSQCCATFIQIK